jgi:hypothetical protein
MGSRKKGRQNLGRRCSRAMATKKENAEEIGNKNLRLKTKKDKLCVRAQGKNLSSDTMLGE